MINPEEARGFRRDNYGRKRTIELFSSIGVKGVAEADFTVIHKTENTGNP